MIDQLYRQQLKVLVQEGDHVIVGGRPTKEMLNVITRLPQGRRLALPPGRELNPFLALSESLWLLAGRDDVASLLPFNKGITKFSDDGETLYGAYGKRIVPQIDSVLARLRNDPNDRRAVIAIWQQRDLTAQTKDPPCNDLLLFKLRDNALHLTVMNRSNDLHWGLWAVNVPQFGVLQDYMAARLGAVVGWQTHISNSLHIYLDAPGQKITDRMQKLWEQKMPEVGETGVPLFSKTLKHHNTHQSMRFQAGQALDSIYPMGEAFLEFASDFLNVYRKHKRNYTVDDINTCRNLVMFPEWVLAAQLFCR